MPSPATPTPSSAEAFCACGRPQVECNGSRATCPPRPRFFVDRGPRGMIPLVGFADTARMLRYLVDTTDADVPPIIRDGDGNAIDFDDRRAILELVEKYRDEHQLAGGAQPVEPSRESVLAWMRANIEGATSHDGMIDDVHLVEVAADYFVREYWNFNGGRGWECARAIVQEESRRLVAARALRVEEILDAVVADCRERGWIPNVIGGLDDPPQAGRLTIQCFRALASVRDGEPPDAEYLFDVERGGPVSRAYRVAVDTEELPTDDPSGLGYIGDYDQDGARPAPRLVEVDGVCVDRICVVLNPDDDTLDARQAAVDAREGVVRYEALDGVTVRPMVEYRHGHRSLAAGVYHGEDDGDLVLISPVSMPEALATLLRHVDEVVAGAPVGA